MKILSFWTRQTHALLISRTQIGRRFAKGGHQMIDWARVKELRDEIGADDFDEVVALFLEEADEVIARISPELGAKALEADLHFLKGAALNLGFAAFAALCQQGERWAAEGNPDIKIDPVRGSYHDSKIALGLGLAQSLAA